MESGGFLRLGPLNDEQEEKERITIQVLTPGLEAGKKYRISIDFVSILNDELRGLYRSTYEEGGQTKYFIFSNEVIFILSSYKSGSNKR